MSSKRWYVISNVCVCGHDLAVHTVFGMNVCQVKNQYGETCPCRYYEEDED